MSHKRKDEVMSVKNVPQGEGAVGAEGRRTHQKECWVCLLRFGRLPARAEHLGVGWREVKRGCGRACEDWWESQASPDPVGT